MGKGRGERRTVQRQLERMQRDAAYRAHLEANPGTNQGGGSRAGPGSAQGRRRAKNRGRNK